MRVFLIACVMLGVASCARSISSVASDVSAPVRTRVPGPRTSPGLVYSPALRRVLLTDGYSFGDTADFPSGEIWSWDGTRWQPMGRDGPPARTLAAAAYDSRTNTLVTYGGARPRLTPDEPIVYRGVRPTSPRRDTWWWDGRAWHPSADTGPGYRDHHVMAYDEARGRTVLFGGVGVAIVGDSIRRDWLSDTWEWDGRAWTRFTAPGPIGRARAGMVYDERRREVVVFGGAGDRPAPGQPQPYLDDTWTWNGARWRKIEGAAPPARYAHAMAYDSRRGVVLMYGGSGTTQNFVDFWQWDGERWSEITMTGPNPGVRYSPGMVYDASRGRVVLYGGLGLNAQGQIGTTLADTWEWDGERWQPVVPRP